jgi:trk system potassium uptake protein TrkA
MNMIVVGCGRMGAELAYRLYLQGHQVAVIDEADAAFNNLHPEFQGRTIEGDALNRDVLQRAGIEQAGGLAAVTNSDSINAVIAHVARTVFQVPNVVVRNYEARWRLIHEVFGLQTVSSTVWGAQRIEELLHSADLRPVFSAGNGEVDVYETVVPPAWEGQTLGELLGVNRCLPVAITRAGRALLPTPGTRLERGDLLHVSATLEGIEALRQRLIQTQEKG